MSRAVAMAKKKSNDVSVKIDAEVYRLVRTVAAWRGVKISDYLSEIVSPVVKRHMAQMNQESEGAEGEET